VVTGAMPSPRHHLKMQSFFENATFNLQGKHQCCVSEPAPRRRPSSYCFRGTHSAIGA
jgi:hypothetical protein